jgi:hypothetical protein
VPRISSLVRLGSRLTSEDPSAAATGPPGLIGLTPLSPLRSKALFREADPSLDLLPALTGLLRNPSPPLRSLAVLPIRVGSLLALTGLGLTRPDDSLRMLKGLFAPAPLPFLTASCLGLPVAVVVLEGVRDGFVWGSGFP